MTKSFKTLVILCLIYLLPVCINATSYYWRDAAVTSGNFTDGNNWSTTAGGSAVGGTLSIGTSDEFFFTGKNNNVEVTIDEDITTGTIVIGADKYSNGLSPTQYGSKLVTINTNGHKVELSSFFMQQAEGDGNAASNCKIKEDSSSGYVKTKSFDFPNKYTHTIEVDTGARFIITTTFYANAATTGKLVFKGSGTLYVPASGANVNWGESKVTYNVSKVYQYVESGITKTYEITVTENFETIPNSTTACYKINYKNTPASNSEKSNLSSISIPYSCTITNASASEPWKEKEESAATAVTITSGSGTITIPSGSSNVEKNYIIYCDAGSATVLTSDITVIFYAPDGSGIELARIEYKHDVPRWTGKISSDWDDGGNWSTGVPPDPSKLYDITITNVNNKPIISSGTDDIKLGKLTITGGAILTVTASDRDIYLSGLSCISTGKFTNSSSTVIFNGSGEYYEANLGSNQFKNIKVTGDLTVSSDFTCENLYVSGVMDCTDRTLTVTDDMAVFGSAYNADDPVYPGSDSRFAYYGYTPSTHNASITADGATFKIGKNFYINGADLKGSSGAVISLDLPDSSSSNPVFNSTSSVTQRQWGIPYAVALNCSISNVKVTSTSAYLIASSELQNVTDVDQTADTLNQKHIQFDYLWLKDSKDISGTTYYTGAVADDVLCLVFNRDIENSNGEINSVLNREYASVESGGLWCNGGTVQIIGTAYKDAACTQSLDDKANVIYVKSSSVKWNTDATGSGAGAENSCDTFGTPHDTVLDLSFMEGLFYSANGHTMARGYGYGPYESYKGVVDMTAPVLGHSFAMVGNNKIITIFSEPVDSSCLNDISTSCQLVKMSDKSSPDNPVGISSVSFADSSDTSRLLFTVDRNITFDDITSLYINCNYGASSVIKDTAGNYAATDLCHAISDFAINSVDVIYASSGDGSDGWSGNSLSVVYDFKSEDKYRGKLRSGNDVIIQAKISEGFKAVLYSAKKSDIPETAAVYGNSWMPGSFCFPGVSGSALGSNSLYNYVLSQSVYDFEDGDTLEFMFKLTDTSGNEYLINHDDNVLTPDIPLYVLAVNEAAFNKGDCSSLDVWSIDFAGIKHQKGGVTILNNVIDVNTREQVTVEVSMPDSSNLSIYVMTLDGNIVKRLVNGKVSQGYHYYQWDGTNMKGKACARGLYFIRVIADGIDETRKVMCVKE